MFSDIENLSEEDEEVVGDEEETDEDEGTAGDEAEAV